MRTFVILAHDAPLTPNFPLDDLPGAAGRLDVLCRCVTSGLLQSHGIRTDTKIIVILQDELILSFSGDELRNLHPDERSTAARFRDALEDARNAVGAMAVESSPGVTIRRGGVADVLETAPTLIAQLHPDGDPIQSLGVPDPSTFILSDHHPFSQEDIHRIQPFVTNRCSLGPVAIHADHAITIAHNYLDTAGYERY